MCAGRRTAYMLVYAEVDLCGAGDVVLARRRTSNATKKIKLDGYRAVAFNLKSREDVKLFAKTSIPVRCCITDLNTV
jgi:hypothetical protein